jgi:hypothetical protein
MSDVGGSMKAKKRTVTQLRVRRAPEVQQSIAPALIRAEVIRVDATGVYVRRKSPDLAELACDLLQISDGGSLLLASGDPVLVLLPDARNERGVIIGRIGTKRLAEELVFEAATSMVLRCGESSVTLRNDGKILVKGQDVVSHATRLNRVRGGAVNIN